MRYTFGFLVGLPEVFVVDGVKCRVAAVAADAGAEVAVHATGEDHGVRFCQDFDGEGGLCVVRTVDYFDVGDHVGGVARGTGHGEHSTL